MRGLAPILLAAACGSTAHVDLSNDLAPDRWQCFDDSLLYDAGSAPHADAGPHLICAVRHAPLCVGLFQPVSVDVFETQMRCHFTDSPSTDAYQWAIFYNTACNPADAGACAGQVEDHCIYDNPLGGGYTLNPAFGGIEADGGILYGNPFDAGWSRIWTGTPCPTE